jgi:hypothetical protein
MCGGKSKRQVKPVLFTSNQPGSYPQFLGRLSLSLVPRLDFLQRSAVRTIPDTMLACQFDLFSFSHHDVSDMASQLA